MSTLTSADTIPADETISIFFSGILGPLTGPTEASANILNAFAGTSFIVEAVNIPTLSDIEPPDVVGHFQNYDGAGHSLPGRNITVPEFESFFISRMQTVSGIYEVGIDKIETGSQTPSLFSAGTTTWILLILMVVTLVAAAVLFR